MGKVDTHRDSDVRSTLAPLIDLVEQRRCALVAIGHLSKDAQRAALHRPGGSIAFVAAARLVLALASDPNDPDRRLLASLKRNLCGVVPTLAYRIDEAGLTWESGAVSDVDVEAMFRPSTPSDREERTDAEAVISGLLDDASIWPLDAKHAMEAGQAHGIPDRTMRWTARRLGIRIERTGFGRGGKWLWHRPNAIAADIPATTPQNTDIAPIAPMQEHRDIGVNNNIEAMKSSFPRAREKSADGWTPPGLGGAHGKF
jgi:hypothetical protein